MPKQPKILFPNQALTPRTPHDRVVGYLDLETHHHEMRARAQQIGATTETVNQIWGTPIPTAPDAPLGVEPEGRDDYEELRRTMAHESGVFQGAHVALSSDLDEPLDGVELPQHFISSFPNLGGALTIEQLAANAEASAAYAAYNRTALLAEMPDASHDPATPPTFITIDSMTAAGAACKRPGVRFVDGVNFGDAPPSRLRQDMLRRREKKIQRRGQ